MAGGRQAWCPRCDELRAARPKAACPVCGRQLLTVPSAQPGAPRPRRLERAARRLRALAPAAGAAGVAVAMVAAVATAFAAGRLTRTTPSGPGAAAPTTTVPAFLDEGPETGRRDFNWQARHGRLTVVLRSVTVGTGFSRLELHVDGVPIGRRVAAVQRLRIRDRAGNDLLPGGAVASVPAAASRPSPGGGIDAEVLVDRAVDLPAVAAVELDGLLVGWTVREALHGTLVDPELTRRVAENPEDRRWLAERRGCPGCRLRVACSECTSARLAGSAYRGGQITLLLEALDRPERTALNPSRRRVTATVRDGIAAELPAWIDGSGPTAVVSVAASELAAVRIGEPAADEPMGFEVIVEGQAEQAVPGTWRIRQPGTAP